MICQTYPYDRIIALRLKAANWLPVKYVETVERLRQEKLSDPVGYKQHWPGEAEVVHTHRTSWRCHGLLDTCIPVICLFPYT